MHSIPVIRLFCVLLGSGFVLSAASQQFGGTPPEVSWKQLNSDTAQIIFPTGLDSQAWRVANIIHRLAASKPASLGTKLRKIPVVLQGQTTIANGYVGLGPYRSEFYLTPAPDNFSQGSLNWADQLAIHEYRHVQQFNNFDNGLSKLMRTLFGQEGYALAINASIPDWFYEGDAVYMETVVTDQGRGRLPRFLNAYPALWKADKKYSWMKLRNGSLKDYVPDHYRLGYLLVNYGYEKYGTDFWQKVTRDASAFKGLIYPFQKAIQRHSGISYRQFLIEAEKWYQTKAQEAATGASTAEAGPDPLLPLNKRVLTQYLFPYQVSADSILYLKKANDRRPTFMLRDRNGEQWIRIRDISINDQYSYRNGRVVYAAYESDPRWGWRDYSVIRIFDLQTRLQKTLTSRSKYFTPDISESGERVVAVQNLTNGQSELHVLDALSGELIKRFHHPGVLLYTDPKFLSEDSLAVALRDREGKMSLAVISISDGALERLTPPSFSVLGYPCADAGYIYFTASYDGTDNIYRIARKGGEIEGLKTRWELGNYFVNVANGNINWSAVTADGLQLQQLPLAEAEWTKLDEIFLYRQAIQYPVAGANELAIPDLNSGSSAPRNLSAYPKGTRLFNFHSWRPYYEDPEFTFSLYGQNILNTLETQLYYLYNENEKTSAAGVSATYGRWFTQLNIGSQYTFSRQQTIGNRIRTWDQMDTRIGLSVPLSWARKQTFRSFNVGTNLYFNQEFNKGFYKDSLGSTNFFYLQHFISLSEQVESAIQHIYPRLAYSLNLQFRHAVSKYSSRQFLGTGAIYFPGLASTHNLIFNLAWQETGTRDVRFANRFPYSRGYNAAYFARIWGIRSNYHFPLLYPDWGFGNILYIQRIRANAFYDYARAYDANRRPFANQNSWGGELFFDTKWWNQYELSFGLRVSNLRNRDFPTGTVGGTVFEFIMPVSIIPR